MAQVDVISVNPSKKTLGAINIENIEQMAREYCPTTSSIKLPGFKSICNSIFGSTGTTSRLSSTKLVSVRLLSAIMLIGTSFCLTPAAKISFNVHLFAIVIAAMIAFGVFERLSSALAAVTFGVITALSIPAVGSFHDLIPYLSNPNIFLGMFTSAMMLIVAILGPGKFSLDMILKRLIYGCVRNKIVDYRRNAFLREADKRLSYKAWSMK